MSETMLDASAPTGRETPDIESSTDQYASRFAGPVGEYLLRVQNRAVVEYARITRSGSVLDVGGGHAQLCGPILQSGHRVTVLGSDARCFVRPRRMFGDRVAYVQGNLLDPPFQDRSFDIVLAVRMLAHLRDTARFVAGLCRVARTAVIVDYSDARSVNALAPLLFAAKRNWEGNTRNYRTYRRDELVQLFASQGFGQPRWTAQFFWPMVLHRMIGRPALSRILESAPRALGLTSLLGSPMILRVARL